MSVSSGQAFFFVFTASGNFAHDAWRKATFLTRRAQCGRRQSEKQWEDGDGLVGG
jgi:hypothetical protein